MHLSPSSQREVATQIANFIRLTVAGYRAVAAHADEPCYPEAAVVVITKTGHADRTAEVIVHDDRLVYVSRAVTHVSYPLRREDAGLIVAGFLSAERD